MLRQDMRYADVATPIKRRSAMAATQKSALTAPKPRSARAIQRRQPYSTAGPCPSRCEAFVRGRPVLRPKWTSMGAGCPHGRSGNSLHISPPSASLSRGAPGRIRQSRRNNDRGAFTCLDRSDRRSGGALQRADLASRRLLADISGRLSIRSPQPYDRLPMWRIAEQTILRWQPCIDQI